MRQLKNQITFIIPTFETYFPTWMYDFYCILYDKQKTKLNRIKQIKWKV